MAEPRRRAGRVTRWRPGAGWNWLREHRRAWWDSRRHRPAWWDSCRHRRAWWEWSPLGALSVLVLAGGVAWLTGRPGVADLLWAVATVASALPATWLVVRALRHGRIGVDVIAVLALVGALLVREYLAGAVVAVMLATGRTLEAYAQRRATRDLDALLARAPRTARRRTDSGVEVLDVAEVRVGDRLLVGPGEVVAVDGTTEEPASLDESVVTGESRLVHHRPGEQVASGVVNAGPAFGMRATATAAESTYAGIVRLAERASAAKAPTVRIADRYAAAFVPFTLALSGLAWGVSGEFLRAVAVLVVATPCPLLLATPIAIVAGLSRVARRGVLVRDGGSLEVLGRARTLLLDKTGTLTAGRPKAVELVAAPGRDRDEMLRLAASVEQLSPHVLAAAVVREATDRGLDLAVPDEVNEEPGRGVTGRVAGHTVRVGQLAGAPPEWAEREQRRAELDGSAVVWIALDEVSAGALFLRDPVRPDARRTTRRLRAAGFRRLVMLTGDRPEVADQVARVVGVDDVVARCTPEEKVARVRAEADRAVTVMVGDGVNDAPALAAADVGVAIGTTGATASADIADAVLTVDRLDRLADAVEIARRARGIAVQSAVVGMSLAVLAMAVAAVGWLPPVAGAVLQEGIDVVVILNALRALGGGVRDRPLPVATVDLLNRYAAGHRELRDLARELREVADLMVDHPDDQRCLGALRTVRQRLTGPALDRLGAEERELYPALAGVVGPAAGIAGFSRTHVEIRRLADRLDRHLDQAGSATDRLPPDQVPDLLATLYGLEAVLRLHLDQEEEDLYPLASGDERPRTH